MRLLETRYSHGIDATRQHCILCSSVLCSHRISLWRHHLGVSDHNQRKTNGHSACCWKIISVDVRKTLEKIQFVSCFRWINTTTTTIIFIKSFNWQTRPNFCPPFATKLSCRVLFLYLSILFRCDSFGCGDNSSEFKKSMKIWKISDCEPKIGQNGTETMWIKI